MDPNKDTTETSADTAEAFDESALVEAAVEAAEAEADSDDDAGDDEGDSTTGGAAESGTSETSEGQGKTVNLTSLRAIAAERSKAQREQQQETPPPVAEAPLDMAQLAEQLSGGETYKKAAAKLKEGDASELAKLLGVDEATLYERWTDRAIRGDASALENKVKTLTAELAELKGRALPDDVMTSSKLQAREQEAAYAENRTQFSALASDAEKHPVLSKIDAELALQYGMQANQILQDTGQPLSVGNLLSVAEELAAEQLGGLLKAQQSNGHAQQSSGVESEASAPPEPLGSTRAGVTIDNRAAAESASPLPDFFDEAAYVARARKVAESM